MNALIDTNVILDVLTGRQPFFKESSQVLDHAERGDFIGWICATTVTTIFYLARRSLGREATIARLEDLLAICSIAPVNQSVIYSTIKDHFSDFEDGVLHHSAVLAGADCIITRNVPDFRASTLLIYTPSQFLSVLAQKETS